MKKLLTLLTIFALSLTFCAGKTKTPVADIGGGGGSTDVDPNYKLPSYDDYPTQYRFPFPTIADGKVSGHVTVILAGRAGDDWKFTTELRGFADKPSSGRSDYVGFAYKKDASSNNRTMSIQLNQSDVSYKDVPVVGDFFEDTTQKYHARAYTSAGACYTEYQEHMVDADNQEQMAVYYLLKTGNGSQSPMQKIGYQTVIKAGGKEEKKFSGHGCYFQTGKNSFFTVNLTDSSELPITDKTS